MNVLNIKVFCVQVYCLYSTLVTAEDSFTHLKQLCILTKEALETEPS